MDNDQYTQLFKYMESQFSALGERLDKQDDEMRRLGGQVNSIEGNIAQLGERLDGHDRRFDDMEQRFDAIDRRFDVLDEGQDEILNAIGKDFNKHDRWIHQIADTTETKLRPAA